MQDYRDVLFHDAGDRVAQLLLLAAHPPEEAKDADGQPLPLQQFLCLNTHLLFPHNE
tara:strand:- start:324 stop:494 length:171 start_codon:yes stop_codon:yes gene_type:complete